ncbi:MAG: DUF2723 domain-containing protein [Proteobacteria bacterium]|nr:DUF2723 domain-containing protein [Pseudomonadota bacterium]MCP4919407.1 DUF2723 domain-containing protein [Pseudomonadota bacterium]
MLLFAVTASRTVQGGDAGEFMTLAFTDGAAHAPGYPLFVAWLRAWAWLPLGEVALRTSLATAVLGAAAVGVLHRAADRWTGSNVAAWCAAGALATTGAFWRYATVAEVFAPAALVAALVVWIAVEVDRGWDGRGAAVALGLTVGVGLTHHHTVVLLAPLIGWTAWRTRRRAPLALVAVPPLSYGLLLGEDHLWGRIAGLDDLVDHVLRRGYGTFSLSGSGADVAFWEHPVAWALRLPAEWVFGFGVVGLLAAWRVVRDRGLGTAVVASWVVAGPVFLALFDVPAEGLGLVVAERFHILPAVLFALLVGRGTAELGQRGRFLLLLIPVSVAVHWRVGDHARWNLLDDYVRGVLDEAPPDAVVLVQGDSAIYGLLYAQQVLALRPDVDVLSPTLLQHPDYRPDIPRPEAPGLLPLVESFERPVCLQFELARGELLPPAHPGGLLLHLQPTDARPQPVPVVSAELEARSWEAALLFEYRAAASLQTEKR